VSWKRRIALPVSRFWAFKIIYASPATDALARLRSSFFVARASLLIGGDISDEKDGFWVLGFGFSKKRLPGKA
jgi:hypothetical protein